METSINITDTETAFFSSDTRKWINKIRACEKQHPDQVTVISQPEDNDGCIYAKIPASWVRIQPKKTVVLSEEEKEALAARLKKNKKA